MNLKLLLTCSACPEQYDVFVGDLQVGYIRLRHGALRVDCPNVGGETVFEAEPNGDGCFDDDERGHYLALSKTAIKDWIERNLRDVCVRSLSGEQFDESS